MHKPLLETNPTKALVHKAEMNCMSNAQYEIQCYTANSAMLDYIWMMFDALDRSWYVSPRYVYGVQV